MAWWKILILSIAFFAGYSNAFRSRMINGKDSQIEDFPYQVSVRYYANHFCGGSIISERHILTAGHCIGRHMTPPYKMSQIVTGTSYRFKQGNTYKIANATAHPKLACDGNRCINDIAVITLADSIVFDKYQQKINLPEHDFEVGHEANVTGWGWTNQSPITRPEQLQSLQTKLVSPEECQKTVIDPENTKIFDTEVCAFRNASTGVCHGDSGSPLAVNGEIVGIVSWTDGDYCAVGRPDVYTNVYKFRDFIKSAMGETV